MLDYLEREGPPLQVVPLGIHYECPWAFRSKVEVVVGAPIPTELPAEATRMERLRLMKRRVQAGLEEAGVNVASAEQQRTVERLAYAATLGTDRSYFECLKWLEKGVPDRIMTRFRELEAEMGKAGLWLHQDMPLFPAGPVALYALALCLLSPFVLGAVALNLPAFAAGWFAGRKFPDGQNVISLWKILVGIPIFALWMLATGVTLAVFGKFWWLPAYGAVTWLGLRGYYRFKKLAVATHNALRRPGLRSRVLAFHRAILESLPDEPA
jgi:hypothetical protein